MNDVHIEVGAYALGLLEAEDRRASRRIQRDVPILLRRRTAARRRQVRRAVVPGAAARVAAIGGGLAAGLAVAPSHSQTAAASPVLTGQLQSADNPRTGVTGTVGLVTKAWGTYVTLDLADAALTTRKSFTAEVFRVRIGGGAWPVKSAIGGETGWVGRYFHA